MKYIKTRSKRSVKVTIRRDVVNLVDIVDMTSSIKDASLCPSLVILGGLFILVKILPHQPMRGTIYDLSGNPKSTPNGGYT